MDGEAVRREVLTAFEYAHYHDDWVNPLSDALEGVSAQEAAWKPRADFKSIWEIVLHMAVWTENIVRRMQTGEIVRPAEGPWPPVPVVQDEAGWEQARQRLWDALAGLRTYIEGNPPEALMSGPYGMADLLCRLIHNAYHIGQITKMRELLRAQNVGNG